MTVVSALRLLGVGIFCTDDAELVGVLNEGKLTNGSQEKPSMCYCPRFRWLAGLDASIIKYSGQLYSARGIETCPGD